MPVHGEKKNKVTKDGKTQEVFNVEFTNGGITQLDELKEFFKADDLVEVVQLGLAYLQRLKEMQQKKEMEEK